MFLPLRRSRRAFTLVELIVVVIVIALLAAIAAIAYNRFLGNTRETAARANLSELVKAAIADAHLKDDPRLNRANFEAALDGFGGKVITGASASATSWRLLDATSTPTDYRSFAVGFDDGPNSGTPANNDAGMRAVVVASLGNDATLAAVINWSVNAPDGTSAHHFSKLPAATAPVDLLGGTAPEGSEPEPIPSDVEDKPVTARAGDSMGMWLTWNESPQHSMYMVTVDAGDGFPDTGALTSSDVNCAAGKCTTWWPLRNQAWSGGATVTVSAASGPGTDERLGDAPVPAIPAVSQLTNLSAGLSNGTLTVTWNRGDHGLYPGAFGTWAGTSDTYQVLAKDPEQMRFLDHVLDPHRKYTPAELGCAAANSVCKVQVPVGAEINSDTWKVVVTHTGHHDSNQSQTETGVRR